MTTGRRADKPAAHLGTAEGGPLCSTLPLVGYSEVKKRVEQAQGVLTVGMGELRDAADAGRLGVNVRSKIARGLAGIGLGHIPAELPNDQNAQVRLYDKGSQVGELVERVLRPGAEDDMVLRELFGEDKADYATIVQQIRDLVSE